MTEDLASLTAAVHARRAELDRRAGQAEQLDRQISDAGTELDDLRHRAELHAQAVLLFTSIGEQAQETARGWVERLATRALQVVFGENLTFHLKPGERGGQATLEMLVRASYPDGRVVETGVFDGGGGKAAVIGFVLNLVVLLLTPQARRVLFLDETFAMVSASYESRVAELCREVADKANVQVVLVTHSPVYGDYADETTRLELGPDGLTAVHRSESE